MDEMKEGDRERKTPSYVQIDPRDRRRMRRPRERKSQIASTPSKVPCIDGSKKIRIKGANYQPERPSPPPLAKAGHRVAGKTARENRGGGVMAQKHDEKGLQPPWMESHRNMTNFKSD